MLGRLERAYLKPWTSKEHRKFKDSALPSSGLCSFSTFDPSFNILMMGPLVLRLVQLPPVLLGSIEGANSNPCSRVQS
jgi:hypothetical protein